MRRHKRSRPSGASGALRCPVMCLGSDDFVGCTAGRTNAGTPHRAQREAAPLAVQVDHVHAVQLLGQPAGHLQGAVHARVVRDGDPPGERHPPAQPGVQGAHAAGQRTLLVVDRDDDLDRGNVGAARECGVQSAGRLEAGCRMQVAGCVRHGFPERHESSSDGFAPAALGQPIHADRRPGEAVGNSLGSGGWPWSAPPPPDPGAPNRENRDSNLGETWEPRPPAPGVGAPHRSGCAFPVPPQPGFSLADARPLRKAVFGPSVDLVVAAGNAA